MRVNISKQNQEATQAKVVRRQVELDTLKAIIERAASHPLSTTDCQELVAAVETLAFLTREIETKGVTIARLRKCIFGSASEKTKDILDPFCDENSSGKQEDETNVSCDETGEANAPAQSDDELASSNEKTGEGEQPKKKRKGHGRKSANDYVAAEHIAVPHRSLKPKDACPCCETGKVYEQQEPAVLVRVSGVSPLHATIYEKQRLRCHMCGQVFTADSPEGVGEKKYDETGASMIAFLKYGCGLPFNRIERLGDNLGIPLPAGTQWQVVLDASQTMEPVWDELNRQAAQGDVIHIDDTKARVLDLHTELQKALAAGESERTGIFTSGIVSTVEEHELVLFYTGNKHAGENLDDLMKQRSQELGLPIQMSDALSCNKSKEFETILASCLVHARRNFVDIFHSFPEEVRYVLEELQEVYHNDAVTKEQELTPEARLIYHQEHSQPVMKRLEQWFQQQIDEKRVEPNSTLGRAIQYMRNHWQALTLFLRVAGAPLDNNVVERALKRAILHRKNSLFYKTPKGAHVGDIFMSLIYTAERQGEEPFAYLVALQRYHEQVKQSPSDWMPYNYRNTIASLAQPP